MNLNLGALAPLLGSYLSGLVYLAAALLLLALGRLAFARLNRRYDLKAELIDRDNPAVAVVLAGHLIGLALAVAAAAPGRAVSLQAGLRAMLLDGLLAILLLHLSAWINDKVVLRRVDDVTEVAANRNCAAAAAIAANQVATGLIIAGLLSGAGTWLSLVVFWLLGQAALVLMAEVYDWITPYDVQAELRKGNLAVGAGFAGVLLALANVVRTALAGDFSAWGRDLALFSATVIFGAVGLAAARWLADKLILPGCRLTQEVSGQAEPNVGLGLVEAAIYLGTSIILGQCLG